MNKKSSYIDQLSSGHESDTVKEYDPAKSEEQIGKEHEEKVTTENNWEDDNRDAIGRAAKRKKLARKLRRLAREIEAMGMDEDYEDVIEEAQEMAKEEVEEKQDEPEDLGYDEEEMCSKNGSDESIIIEATHPIEHDPMADNPEANASAQMGDEEWIEIGPGDFDDMRDGVGRAA